MMNMKQSLQVNGANNSNNSLLNAQLNVVPGPVKTRTGNAHRERSEDFALRQVQQKYGQNSAAMGRFMNDSPLNMAAQKFIPRKGMQSDKLTPNVASFKRNSSHETGKTQTPGQLQSSNIGRITRTMVNKG